MGSVRKVVLVTGDRNWTDQKSITDVLARENETTLILHGGARGADSCADLAAIVLRRPRAVVPYFGNFGRAGGPIRNAFMLDVLLGLKAQGYLAVVFAFHDDLDNSKGTKDMVNRATRAGVEVKRYGHKKQA